MLSNDDAHAIRRLGAAWEDAWNRHDMPALTSLVGPEHRKPATLA
jgi:ketosteroid isomerase-like protein